MKRRYRYPEVVNLRDYANQDLYHDGKTIPWRSHGGFENLLKSIFRARVINYEILDYYLQSDRPQIDYLIDIAEGLHRNDYRDLFSELFQRTFGFPGEEQLINVVAEEVVLLGLCGVNAIYRRHIPSDTRAMINSLAAQDP